MNLLNSVMFLGDIEFQRNMIFTFLRQFVAAILAFLYGLIGLLLEVVLSVAQLDNLEMFQELYEGIQDRFYVIIGVVMLFKMTVSLITYFANPDKITDKEMGAGKLVTRFIMVLILLIFVPQYLFKFLGRIQTPIISTLGKVVLNTNVALTPNEAHNKGQVIATTIFGGFFQPRDGCGGTEITTDIFDTAVTKAAEACSESKDTYKYSFNFTGAFICILPIIVLLIIIGIQVAIRAFKLILLKIIAPIPIISYMDPKAMKDGGKTSVYVKMFITTYIDLFIHFGALYFVILACNSIFGLGATTGQIKGFLGLAAGTDVFGMVFVVIGLLFFAFKAPKFVKKALGLKDSEFGSGLAGLLTTTASVAGMVGSGVAGFTASAATTGGGHLIQNFGAGISSAIRGGRAGYNAAGEKSDFTKVLSGIRTKNAELAADRASGVTMGHRAREIFYSTFTGKGPGAQMMSEVEALDKTLKEFKDMKSGIDAEAAKGKYGTVRTNKVAGYDWIYGKSKDFAGVASVAKSQQLSEFDYNYTDENGVTHNQRIQTKDADWIKGELEKAESAKLYSLLTGNIDPAEASNIEFNQYIDSARNGNPDLVGKIDSLAKSYEMGDLRTVLGTNMEIYFNKLGDQMKVVEQRSLQTKNSTEYMAAQAAAKKNK